MEILLLLLQNEQQALLLQILYPDVVAQARSLIRAHLSEEWSLERLAQATQMSISTFKRRLQAAGLGYRQLLDQERMNQAINHLTQTDQTVAEVAQACGYRSPSRFAARFRRYYGQSPSEMRATLKKNERT